MQADVLTVSTFSLIVSVLALAIMIVGGIFAAARWQSGRMDRIAERFKSEDDRLHGRINEVREQFVRRDDLRDHIDRIEKGQDRLEAAVKAMNGRLDHVFRPPVRGDGDA